MQAANGDNVPLLKFVDEAKYNAINTVAGLLKCSISTVAIHYETAVDRFIKETKEFNVERIMPLFAWFCKVLRCVVKEQRSLKIKASGDMERFGGASLC